MANRIKIRHGSGTPNNPGQLLPYELGWNGTSLYINNGGTVEKVGKEYLPLTGGTVTGDITMQGGTSTNSTRINLNRYDGSVTGFVGYSRDSSKYGLYITGTGAVNGYLALMDTTNGRVYYRDSYSNNQVSLAYSQSGLDYANYTWLAGWNGYELRAVNKSQFAQASHTHSYLPLAGGTVTGTLVLSKTTDASGTANNSPALIIGGAATAAHIEIDNNEILAKSNDTTPSVLYLQDSSGTVSVAGTGGLTVPYGNLKVGNAHATSTSSHALWGAGITVSDTRYDTIGVTSLAYSANFFFSNNGMPNSNWWSGLHVAGWTGDYNAWELAGPSHNSDQRTQNLCIRVGRTSNGWGAWRALVTSSDTTSRSIFLTTSASVPSGAKTGDIVLVKV